MRKRHSHESGGSNATERDRILNEVSDLLLGSADLESAENPTSRVARALRLLKKIGEIPELEVAPVIRRSGRKSAAG